MARILVTGAQGLLGSSLVPFLQERGHDVLQHSRAEESYVTADLTDFNQVRRALDKVIPETIINLVALTSVDECEKNPNKAYQVNVHSVENLSRWIQKNNNVCHLIHISTDQVYDGSGPHSEMDVALSNYYAFSKYASEMVVSSVSGTVLRTNFFGPSHCLGRISLSDWIINSLKEGDLINVFDDVYFSPLSINSLVELLELIIRKPHLGIYNLGSKEGLSKADFAFYLAETMGLSGECMVKGTSADSKLFAYRPKDMRMNSSKFEEQFGIILPVLKQEIESMKGAYANETR